ncbi:nucleotide disphospho-sugar-binding domain-containing protein [Streptomyces sp. ST2-7A]|uniref:nucleotide disphospho-sugar-binding domain-containing protein n=1 Tax=Streptomyces sp. ST2-7A TaxID=2907214 RepID=UPI001F2E8BB5|nr:nucleotide disphospho-sugar-binding domain-containing protein [Streptomyces sp. ST2-7A]
MAHLHPVVPLAWALRGAGHEVRVAVHPGLADAVGAAGLTAVPLGDRDVLRRVVEFGSRTENLDVLDDSLALGAGGEGAGDWAAKWERITDALAISAAALDDLVAYCRHWEPELVIWDPFCVSAAFAARVSGAAHARFLWGQDNVAWLWERAGERSRQLGEDGADAALRKLMDPMRRATGLELEDELLVGQWTIDPMPPGLRLPAAVDYLAVRRVPYNGSAVVPDWLRTEPRLPRVCLTLGVGGRGRQLFRVSGTSFDDVLAAVAELDVELIATVEASRLRTTSTVPDNVRLIDYLPLDVLLPSCSAVIHHGGGGTFAAAAAHRVPQVVVPMAFWGEAATAAYVAGRGAGLVIDPGSFSAENLRRGVARSLSDPSLRAGAEGLHRALQEIPSPHDIVPSLENLVARHRR